MANVLPAYYSTLLGTIRHVFASPSVWTSSRSEQMMERKMDTNTNFSNSYTQIDAGIPPTMDCHQEVINQLPNPNVMPHVTAILALAGENQL